MHFNEFRLEQYFAKFEFKVKHLFSCSDCEALRLDWLINNMDDEIRKLWDQLKLSYTETRGFSLLRKEIAALYHDIHADQIMTLVPEEGIFLSMNALLEKDDHVIVLAPAYESLIEIPKAIGCHVTLWLLKSDNFVWHLDFEFLKKEVTKKTKLLIVNFPHNPTGFVPTRNEWGELIDFARKKHITLLSDEMYRGLEMEERYCLRPAVECYEKGISLSGLSKTYGLPGLRLGWIVSKDSVFMKKLSVYKDYTTICSSGPSEILGIAALRKGKEIVRKNIDLIKKNQECLQGFAGRYPESIEYIPIRGGSITFPRMINLSSCDIDIHCEKMAIEKSLMVLPGSVFDYPDGYFRAGLGREAFPLALEVLEEYLVENTLI